jgi:copper chaperone NosL
MKYITTALLTFFILTIAVISAPAALTAEQPTVCQLCGMNRTTFAHSRALVEYQDGKKTGTCSINCAVVDVKKNPGRKLKSLKVADFGTKKLINATTASWVIGGSVDGVMTPVPKWAFTRASEARRFVKEQGGWLAPYKEVYQAVNEELQMQEQDKHEHQHNH